MTDYSNSIKNFEDYIGNIGWNYTDNAVRKIFGESRLQKEHILNVLRNHPNFVEEKQAIVFSADYEREPDNKQIYRFQRWLDNKVVEVARSKDIVFTYVLSDIVRYLFWDNSQFMTDEYPINNINELCKNFSELGLEKFKVHMNQKRSRVVGKFCRMFGVDQCEGYEQEFAKFGDALNPLKVSRYTVISVNPADFVMMSNGTSWRSCHNPDKETYSGCNCSGGISHALDTSSIIMYTVHPDYEGDLQMAPKVDRCVFFVDEKHNHFVQSKVYPDGSQQKSDEFREIFQMVWSQCTGEPNLWKCERGTDDSIIQLGYNATCYPDFDCCGRNIIVHFYQSGADKETFELIEAGAEPICVECGCNHSIKDEINCCTYYSGFRCPNCGTEWDDEDDLVYSEFHMETGCPDCMIWNNFCDDYFYYTDEMVWVENIRTEVPRCYIEENWDKFAECAECGEIVYTGNSYYWSSRGDGYYFDEHNQEYYCNSCFNDAFEECADCGEYFRREDMVEGADGYFYCEDCAENLDLDDDEASEDVA